MAAVLEQDTETKDYYTRARDFYSKEKWDNAERCCKKAIAENPNHFDAYNMLAAIAQTKGNSGEAFVYVQKAIAINPQYAEGYNNLGGIYFANKSYDESIACFEKAASLNPSYADAQYNLATAFQTKGQLNEALRFYKNAISLNPRYLKAYINLGNLLIEKGNIDEGVEYYKTAITINELSQTEAYVNLANMILYTQGVVAWREAITSYLKVVSFPGGQQGDMLASLATASWIMGDVDKCLIYLDKSKRMILADPTYLNFKVAITYNAFLRKLILWYQENPDANGKSDRVLYFIGDSHSITCANKTIKVNSGVYECKTRFIRGCKIWHLVKDGNNEFKVAFEREVNSLPENSLLVLTVGEIDCRYDSGLFLRYRKYGTDIKQETDLLLDKYFLKILELVEKRKIVPLLWGVPAPHENIINGHVHRVYKQEFIDFISYFNEQMNIRAKKHYFYFVNNHGFTKNEENYSSEITHIDTIHLKPSIFIKALQEVLQ